MGSKKQNIRHIQGAYNWSEIQFDRDLPMKEVHNKMLDEAAEIDYWDSWTHKQKKEYRDKDKEGENGN